MQRTNCLGSCHQSGCRTEVHVQPADCQRASLAEHQSPAPTQIGESIASLAPTHQETGALQRPQVSALLLGAWLAPIVTGSEYRRTELPGRVADRVIPYPNPFRHLSMFVDSFAVIHDHRWNTSVPSERSEFGNGYPLRLGLHYVDRSESSHLISEERL